MDHEPAGWTPEDDAILKYESLPDWHPSLFVDVFRLGLIQTGANARLAGAFVTPESVDARGISRVLGHSSAWA